MTLPTGCPPEPTTELPDLNEALKVAAAARPGLRRLPIVPVSDLLVSRSELVAAGRLEEEEDDPNVGYYHSYEITGAVNGPGMRFTLFVNGCPLRCQYCHNPDTWMMRNGRRVTADRMMEEIAKYTRVLKVAHGGLTITGGEPMLQIKFTGEIFRRARHDLDLHTCLDTSGYLGDRASEEFLDNVDLILLDIKSWDPATFRLVTSADVEPTLRFARRLSDRGSHMWIRFVLVPGLTDAVQNVDGVADYVASLQGVDRVEVLRFHQFGVPKWDELGVPYQLREVRPPEPELVARVEEQFRSRGLNVV
jgi:pyruvate formate lyase activating enzyme